MKVLTGGPSTLSTREVTVTYKCGHQVTDNSASEAEDADRIRTAAIFYCIGCELIAQWNRQFPNETPRRIGL